MKKKIHLAFFAGFASVLGLLSLGAGAQAQSQTQPPPSSGAAATATNAAPAPVDISGLLAQKPFNNELSISGDFLYGKGDVTLPFGFALSHAKTPSASDFLKAEEVGKPSRTTEDYGATLSYSYGQAWFIDLSYEQGHDNGSFTLPSGVQHQFGLNSKPTSFTIDDSTYQAYLRYNFKRLRFTRFSAYLRGGVSYSPSTLDDNSTAGLEYHQRDRISDVIGELGGGANYKFINGKRLKLGLQLEVEGFYGDRSQDDDEYLQSFVGPRLQSGASISGSTTFNNDLYGGIGRVTLHLEYRLGQARRFKLFMDGGLEGKTTEIKYDSASGSSVGGTYNELLWGPYVKAGLSFSF